MHHLTSLQDKIVSECQALINQLKQIHTAEDLFDIQPTIRELTEKLGFLKVLKENPMLNDESEPVSQGDVKIEIPEATKDDAEIPFTVYIPNQEVSAIKEGVILEEQLPLVDDILIGNEVKETDQSETETAEHHSAEDDDLEGLIQPINVLIEDSEKIVEEAGAQHLEPIQEEIFEEELIAEAPDSEDAYERSVQLVENEELKSRNIETNIISDTEKQQEEERIQDEKKFRLAQIKGLNKNSSSLFEEEEMPVSLNSPIAKSNMPTDYMEAPKAKPDFKLDLNDKIAFSQKLFAGSQSDMNEAVRVLNTFETIDEAKVYLSDIYYKKNWDKVDDYAQRLWALVENKFL